MSLSMIREDRVQGDRRLATSRASARVKSEQAALDAA